MVFSKLEKIAYEIALPVAKEYNYSIYDIEYIKEGSNWFLRIYIDRDEGVLIDDCEVISRQISQQLDDYKEFKENYYLEVSSPGLERVLRQNEHFEWAIGKTIRVKLYKAENGKKEFEGVLLSASTVEIKLDTMDEEKVIARQAISKANIVFDFSSI